MAGTLFINGTDIQDYALIRDASGLLSNPPIRGDLITFDFTDGAIWQAGVADVFTFDLYVLMAHRNEEGALADLAWLQQWQGQQVTLIRRLDRGSGTVDESCTAVMNEAVRLEWDFYERRGMSAMLTFTVLSGGWEEVIP